MRSLLFILRKDLHYMLRAKETLVWVFVMPIIFFFFIGTVTGGFSGAGGTARERIALDVGENPGFLLDQLVIRLQERDYEIVAPEAANFAAIGRRLQVPAAFTDSVLAGRQVKLTFTGIAEDLRQQYENMRVSRAVYTLLADVIVAGPGDRPLNAEDLDALNAMPRQLRLEIAPAGKRLVPPSGYEQTIPGVMVMFVLLVMCTSGAILLVIERRQGLLRRLACTPISRAQLVLGKWGGKFALGMVQIAFAMLVGTVIFKMNWGAHLPAVITVMLTYGAMMAALGMVLGSLARTEAMAAGIGVITANVMAALGGCWWPIEITPAWMQKLQLFLPTGWAMNALHKLISFGYGPFSVLPQLVVMTLATVILLVIAMKVFRYE